MSLRVEIDRHFISFIAYNTNYKQLEATLYEIDESQYIVLREIALNIVSVPSIVHLEKSTKQLLKPHWTTLKDLAKGKFTRRRLKENAFIIPEICRLALHHYCTNKSDTK